MSQSQHSGSIVSADNAQIKYKKALKEISKLINANRTLRQNHEKQQRDLKEKIDQLSLRYEDLLKQYDTVRKEKQSFAHYLDQIQKQRNNLDRQVAYLNDVLAQQNAELKKLNMHKDERAIAALIRTYQEKEATMSRNRNQNQEMIAKLKSAVERLQNDIQEERTSKEEYEDRYKALSLEMNRYKEQNSSLLDQIERLLRQNSQKDSYCVQKQKQLRSLITQFQKQISLLRSAQEQSLRFSNKGQNQNYQQLLNEKNRMAIDLTKLQNAYEEVMMRQKEFFEIEQRMKAAKLQADRANEQVNMLKSKIVVLQAKQFLDEGGDDDYDQKQFEERLNLLVSQNDPLNSIKNHDDNSHFRILKAFIVDLQDKVYKTNSQKKEVTKKYKSIKVKFVKNAEQLRHYEEQNKIMKGKLEGYQRLTQKLQFELQKALANHEQEITRMTITSNNIITKKIDQYKSTISLLNSQLEMNHDKADRTEKNYKQEIQTLKLELDTLKIKVKDQSDKSGKDTELIQLYKKKNSQLSTRINSLQEQLANNNDNLAKFQHLFKQQKGKNQGLLAQKQQLLAQTRQLTEQIDKKSSSFTSNFKIKQDQYQFEIKKLKTDNQKLRDEIEYSSRELVSLQKQIDQKRRGDQGQVEQIKRQTQRNVQLQSKISELRKKIRDLEDQNESIKIKSKKFQENYDKINKFEQQNITKNDKINDLTRDKLMLQSQIKNLKNQLNDEKKQSEQYKKQLSNMKMKSLQISHESKREYQAKLFQSKKNSQSLNQDISDLTTELRQQKSKNMKLLNQLNIVKAEKDRLQQIIEQNRKRDLQNEGQVGNYKIDLSNAQMQIQRLRSDIKGHQLISNNLNQQIETLQQKIFTLNQEVSALKMKLQSSDDLKNDLIRDLNSLKTNFSSVESQTNQSKSNINLPWPEQNFYSNLSDILSRVRKICRNYGINIQTSSTTITSTYRPAPVTTSYVPSYTQQTTSTFTKTTGREANTQGDGFKQYFKSYSDSHQVPKAAVAETSSKGNGYLEYFKSYADTDGNKYQTSYTKPFEFGDKGKNFDSNIGTAQSIGLGKVDYTYSQSNLGSNEAIGNNTLYGTADYWKQPAYDYGQTGKSNYEFNFSGLSNVNE